MSPGREGEFGWTDIRSAWTVACMTTGIQLDKGIELTDILLTSPEDGRKIGTGIVDWWPAAELVARRAQLAKHGIMGANWSMRKGTVHTAELLLMSKGNSEAQAAVFIAASVWDKQKSLPEAWRG